VFVDPVTVGVNCLDSFTANVHVGGATDTITPGITVTVAVPNFVGSATLVARTVTVAGLGTDDGAMYSPPIIVIVPFDEGPSTDHVTPMFVDPVTLAVNSQGMFTATVADRGDTVTVTTGVTVKTVVSARPS